MKKTFFLVVGLSLGVIFGANAQVDNNVPKETGEASANSDPIFMFAEKNPEYPGGPEALSAFLMRAVQYSAVTCNNGDGGTVFVQFVVEKDGTVSNAKVQVPLSPECDNEAIRVIMAMPRWKPGKNNGEPVRCFYQVPVTFRKVNSNSITTDNTRSDAYDGIQSKKPVTYYYKTSEGTYNWRMAELKGRVKSVETKIDGHSVTVFFNQTGRIAYCSWRSLHLSDNGLSQRDLFPDEPCNPFRGVHLGITPLRFLSDYVFDMSYLNPVLRTETHPDADTKFRLSSGIYYYSYNSKGLLDRIYGARLDDPNRKVLVYRFQYDSNNRLIKRYTQDSLPTMKIEYDDRFGVKNALFDVTFYNDRGKQIKKIKWGNVGLSQLRNAKAYSNTILLEGYPCRDCYDAYVKLSDDGSFKLKEVDDQHYHYVLDYNDAGQITKVALDYKGNTEEYLFFYNNHNDLNSIQVNCYNPHNGVSNKYSYEYDYVYDSHGNWTEMCTYYITHKDIDVKDLISGSKITRKIEYYE